MSDLSTLWAQVYKADQYKKFKREVRKRDGYQCTMCNSRGTRNRTNRLHVHHILPKAKFLNSIFDISNGIVLCSKCHIKEHARMRETGEDYAERDSVPLGTLKTFVSSLTFTSYNAYVRRKRTYKKPRYKNNSRKKK